MEYECAIIDLIRYEIESSNFDKCEWEIIDDQGNVRQTFEGDHPNMFTNNL